MAKEDIEMDLPQLPEAPMSTHIDAYFKGFHVGFTIRSQDNTVIPVIKVRKVVENLIKEGYEPSWNTDTSQKHLTPAPQSASVASQGPKESIDPIMNATAPVCGIHGVTMVWKEGISKKTNAPYAFYSCPERNADGSFCRYQPPKK
jgi:hypothetical protein